MRLRPSHSRPAACAVAALLAAAVLPATSGSAGAAEPTALLLTEYVEGSSNNKALEIWNGTAAPVDLGAAGYDVQVSSNGAATAGTTVALSGTVAPGDVFVLAHSSAAAEVLAVADQTSGAGLWNGDDAITLRRGGAVVDSLGQVGVDPGSEWGSGATSTADNTLRRKAGVTVGDVDPTDAFDPAVEWDGFDRDTFSGLGAHPGEPTGPEDPEDPPVDAPSPECDAAFTRVGAIQGSGGAAAVTGLVATEGVVVGDHEGPSPRLRGFYLQDPEGDGDAATSDGIFVFHGNADEVALGDRVRVVGTAEEYQGQTQVSQVTSVEVCASGLTVAPTPLTFPLDQADLERVEGMLVSVPETMTVTEHFQLGRFGQVVVSSGGRLLQPTDVVAPGDPARALQQANDRRRLVIDDSSQAQNPDPIVWGRDGQPLSATNTLRGGDTVTGAVGVLTYTWGGNAASPNAYRLRPLGALGGQARFEAANPRPESAPAVGGSLRVAGMNVLNYFNTFTGCTLGVAGGATDCRGADDATELERQAAKTVAALSEMDADVVGVVEIENDGYGPGSALADLVDRLDAVEGEGSWAYVDADAGTGQVDALGTDAIKVGLLYRPAAVSPVGETAALNTTSFVTGGEGGEARNRPALAQAFREKATGETFTAVVNHLKSKGSACDVPDAGDGQGNCNEVRRAAAAELADWLAGDPTGTGDPDVLVLGDLNAYAQEDPVRVLEEAGYVDLVGREQGEEEYSYVFDGQWGSLDHALGSASLASQVAGAAPWHVNADEPSVLDYNTDFKTPAQVESLFAPDEFRNSDHDPVVVGLDLAGPVDAGSVLGGGFVTGPDGKGVFALAVHARDGQARGVVSYLSRTVRLSSAAVDSVALADGRARIAGRATVAGGAGRYEVVATDGGRRGEDTLRVVLWDATGRQVADTGERVVTGQVNIKER
ncbi:ExeM/NucH family extracellular endonuclease [Nocardioides solisilvae]|uniref:ExeM/NucH family extracellular endonuclease n=1 Tax=Nocardioides solisilvae TaxID=1542435 RepID=UPI000D7415C8|nr:ExeM/NucH family extracellular endonuclease [Nocardioides solisilvae]